MKARDKDIFFTAAVIIAIIALGALIVNMDKMFTTRDAQASFRDILTSTVNYNLSSSEEGTNPGAKVTLMEISDFLCPYCRSAAKEVMAIISEYGNDVNFVHVNMPGHAGSQEPAEASECARDQGKFLEYYAVLWLNTDYSVSSLMNYAEEVGLDRTFFSACLLGREKADLIAKQAGDAAALGVRGTPTFFVNNQMLVGYQSFTQLKTAIDEELEK